MTDRIQLNEQEMDKVVGGAFRYREDANGDLICKVDDIGYFHASDNAQRKINSHWMNNQELTVQELVDWAVANGYLWS